MKRRGIMVVVAGAVAVWGATPLAVASAANARAVSAAIGTVSTAGTWGNAIEVPGLGTLNAGGSAEVPSISCASASNCVAGGSYFNGSGHSQAFVVRKVKGTWGTPKNVPGLATLNTGMAETLLAVSCASAGNCAIGGSYVDVSRRGQAYVDSERNGTWGKAIEVPGSGTLNVDGFAQITSMSCPSAGNCTAGGFYEDGSGHLQALVVSEVNGTWGTAIEVPGSGTLNVGGFANISSGSVSCRSAGNCATGGSYLDGSNHFQGFVASEHNGVWGTAIEVPGLGALNTGGYVELHSVSCASAGNCAAGGLYEDASSHAQPFVASEVNGTWGNAIEVPGSAALGGSGSLGSVSCRSAGNCSAGGSLGSQAFVVSEVNGTWGTAIEVPGSAALNAGGSAGISSISCASVGNCAAGGSYTDSSHHTQAFVASEVNGTWGNAIEVPGSGTLNAGGSAFVEAVSCPTAGHCTASGIYKDGSGHQQGFLVSQT